MTSAEDTMPGLPGYDTDLESDRRPEEERPVNSIAIAQLSPVEVKRLAFEQQYNLLYRICQAYEHGKVTWQEAMQIAAVEQSRVCAELTRELIRVIELNPTPIKLNLER